MYTLVYTPKSVTMYAPMYTHPLAMSRPTYSTYPLPGMYPTQTRTQHQLFVSMLLPSYPYISLLIHAPPFKSYRFEMAEAPGTTRHRHRARSTHTRRSRACIYPGTERERKCTRGDEYSAVMCALRVPVLAYARTYTPPLDVIETMQEEKIRGTRREAL